MATSPLQLDHYFFPKIVVEANNDFEPAEGSTHEFAVKVDIEVSRHASNPRKFGVAITIVVKSPPEKALPYEVELAAFGAVTVSEEIPEKYREQLAASNGTQLLYGAAREFIAVLTGRGPWEPLFLPTQVFSDLVPEKAASTKLEPPNAGVVGSSEKRRVKATKRKTPSKPDE